MGTVAAILLLLAPCLLWVWLTDKGKHPSEREQRFWYCAANHPHRTPQARDQCSAAQRRWPNA